MLLFTCLSYIKQHSTTDPLFYWFGFNQASKYVVNFIISTMESKAEKRVSCTVMLSLIKQISVAVVVAQLVERSLPISEVHGSNPVIGKKLFIY